MSAVEPWPQAPVLESLPSTATLALSFEAEQLRRDLRQLQANGWKKIRIVSGDGLGEYATELDWKAIPLRSIGGDGDRGDAGGPDLAEFADTPWLTRLPYLAEVLGSIPAPLASVRLMALGPGARSPVHSDTKVGLPWGMVRLHVPILTVPEATLSIAGERHCWEPGTVWYADFTRGHVVENSGVYTRIHLVVDAYVTPQLISLFPAPFQTPAVAEGSIFDSGTVPLEGAHADKLRCSFDLPSSFRSFEEQDGEFLRDETTLGASVQRYGTGLALYLDGNPVFGLVHIGGNEFRFAGWTAERTLQVSSVGDAMNVILRTRVGSQVRSLTVPAKAAAPCSRV